MKKLILILTISVLTFCGCERNPAGSLMYNGVYDSQTWSEEWMFYDDDLKTRGSWIFPMYTTWGTDEQPNYSSGRVKDQLNIDFRDNPYAGRKCMRMSWDGSGFFAYDTGQVQNGYVGFAIESPDSVNGYNMSAAGYTKLKFMVKGTLNPGVKLIVKTGDGGLGGVVAVKTITSMSNSWHEEEIVLNNTSAVKQMIIIIFENPTLSPDCKGGTVYFDNIRFTK